MLEVNRGWPLYSLLQPFYRPLLQLFRFYNLLAGQYLGEVMAEPADGRQAHPRSLRAQSLLAPGAIDPGTMAKTLEGAV